MSDQLLQLLTAYVDGELSSRQRKQLARLLEKSSEARKMLRRLQADRDGLGALSRKRLPEDFPQRIVAKLRPHSARPIAAKANVFKTWWPAAAAAAIIIGIGLGTSVLLNDLMRGNQVPENVVAKTQPDDNSSVATDTQIAIPPEDQGNALAKNDAPTPEDLNRFSHILDGWKNLLKPLGDGARQMVPSDGPDLALLPNLGDLGGGARPNGGLEFADPPAVLTFPAGPQASAFKTIDGVKMALFLDPKSIDTTKLAERLKQDPIHHVDLACLDSAKTFERLQAACRLAGIRLLIDSELTQRLAKKQSPPVMLYLENTNPDLILKLMNALKDQEVKAEAAKKGESVIDSIMVQPLDEAGRKRLADSLGVAPATLTPLPASPGKTASPGLDPTKPIADGTIKSLEKLASKGKEPTAIALVYYPNRSRVPPSKELKQFQDARVGLESGAIHVVFFVRVNRG